MQILLSLVSRSISICFFFSFFLFEQRVLNIDVPKYTRLMISTPSHGWRRIHRQAVCTRLTSLIIISKEWPKFLKFLNELRTLFTYEIRYGYEKSTSSLKSKIHCISKEIGRGGGGCAVERTKRKEIKFIHISKRKCKTEYLPTRPSLLSYQNLYKCQSRNVTSPLTCA